MQQVDPSGVGSNAAGGPRPLGVKIGADQLPAGAQRGQGVATVVSAPRPAAAEKTASRSMRVANIVVAALLMALGGLVLLDSLRMGIGWGSDGPQGGFVPFWLSTILIFCCALIIVQAARRVSAERFVGREQLARVLKVVLPAASMVLLTEYVGLYVAAALYMGFYMRWAGRHSWIVCIALPLLFAALTFLVFERWFLVPLPKGPLEAWLGY